MNIRLEKPALTAFFMALLTPVYLELALHLYIYREINGRILFPILFALAAGALIFGICACLPRRVSTVLLCVVLGFVTFYFEVQLVYNSIFGEFMSMMQLFTGAAAVTNFFRQMLYGIWKILPVILLFLVPAAAAILLACREQLAMPKLHWYLPVTGVLACAILHFCALGVMAAGGTGAYSVYGLYTSQSTGTEISVHNIGLISTTRLECKYMLFPREEVREEPTYAENTAPVELEEGERYNILDLDFEALAASTEDPVLQELDRYFAAQTPTERHQYTGLLEGYNLITICAESFSSLLIDQERTPTLYKLANGGFVFENFFGTYGSNTTNGEYTFCMGNYPDMSRSKVAASFFASQDNSLPFCLGNAFLAEGYQTWAYHNYSGEYYSRMDTHANMGYVFQSASDGLDIQINWPSSDLEMMEEAVDDFLSSGQPFHAYFMTFSGHYQYNWENPMSLKNKAIGEELPYSEAVQAYIACNQELEHALAYLMERLEQAGVADKTVIVLTNDHYPYGLSDAAYNELAGHEVDTTFERYRNSFICYVPGMEPVTVDTYCSTVDILPTLLNLFGLSYDSRLLAGRDVLSESANNMAVLSDQSFVTADYGFDAATGQVRVFTEGYVVDESDLARRQSLIQKQFQTSLDVLNYDYYSHAVLPSQEGSAGLPAEGSAPEEASPGEEPLPFTDLEEGYNTDCIAFLWRNGYMDAASETKFGFSASGSYAEFLDILYRMEGSPNMDDTWVYLGSQQTISGKYLNAVKWASEAGLMPMYPAQISSYTAAARSDVAVTLMRYAQSLGLPTEVDDETLLAQEIAENPHFTAEELRALHWCYNNLIIDGGGNIHNLADTEVYLIRYQLAKIVYHFWQFMMEGN